MAPPIDSTGNGGDPDVPRRDSAQALPLVLVASPDSRTCETIRKYLHLEGFNCSLASTGEEALAIASAGRVQAALLDVDLPAPDALAVTRALRGEPQTAMLPLLLFARDAGDEEAAFHAGASAIIAKPYHLAAIAARLRVFIPDAPEPIG